MTKPNLLKNWFPRVTYGGGIYFVGVIYNDTKGRFEDGSHIHTSMVRRVDFTTGVVETMNSVYYLDLEKTI